MVSVCNGVGMSEIVCLWMMMLNRCVSVISGGVGDCMCMRGCRRLIVMLVFGEIR